MQILHTVNVYAYPFSYNLIICFKIRWFNISTYVFYNIVGNDISLYWGTADTYNGLYWQTWKPS